MRPTDYRKRSGLHLVEGNQEPVTSAPATPEIKVVAVAQRAGDRHEPWTLPRSPITERLQVNAARAGLDFELAARICIEAALTSAALRSIGVDARVLAQQAIRVGRELDDRDAAYLRRLTQRTAYPPTHHGLVVGLPVRLTVRLLAEDLEQLLDRADVEEARSWEISALLDGRTIGEWAPLAVLRAQRADASD